MFDGLYLKSIKSFMDVDGCVYPLNNNGEPNRNVMTPLQDLTDEWWDSLSENDLDRVNRHLGFF